jgi:hypothetical protein
MTDLAPIAATLLANFATVRIRRRERLWTWPYPDLSLRRHIGSRSIAFAGERLIAGCRRTRLRGHLLEHGHRAFFDRLEGGGPDGWRLHFFCYDPAAVLLLHDIPIVGCGRGDPRGFDPEKFVLHHLRRLERMGLLGTADRWWGSVDE